jgi:penicillin-binding protein 1A
LIHGDHEQKEGGANDSPLPRRLMNSFSYGITSLLSSNRRFYRRVWFWVSLGISGGIGVTVISVQYFISTIDQGLPDKSGLQVTTRAQTLTIRAVDGTILQQEGEATRERLRFEEIPEQLKQAFIASEDRRFAKHNGIDLQGILRASVNNLRSQRIVEGGSTITQQLAKIIFLQPEQTIWRKLQEMRLAHKMEQELTKEQIIERYLNLVYLGSGAYGVADAAWVYFSKSVDELTLAEAAMLAGLAPAPSLYSPIENPTTAIQRRNIVLQRMYEDKLITADDRKASSIEPLNLNTRSPKRLEVKFPYFTSYIRQELPKYVPPEVLKAGGLVVETTLNPQLQEAAEATIARTISNQGRWQNFNQGAMVAIDPRNGEIHAMVGGKDFSKNQFNRVTQAQRQPGSTFKGFVYAAAIATGKSPNDRYLDTPFVINGYEPQNYDRRFRGSMTITDALTRSTNVVAVKLLLDVGFEPIINTARNLGIKSTLQPTYSLALGASEVNLLELTNAYGSLANQGLYVEAHGIRSILNREQEVVWSSDFQQRRVFDPTSAAITTWMLGRTVRSGTGGPAQLRDRPVAGKTGTSEQYRDLWFIGYIPQMVTGVWLGNDDDSPTAGDSGTAASSWRGFMKKAVEGIPVEQFPQKPQLQGRVGSIKAQPIKAKSVRNRSVVAGERAISPTSNVRRRHTRVRRGSQPETTNSPGNVSPTPRRTRRVSSDREGRTTVSPSSPPPSRTRTVPSDRERRTTVSPSSTPRTSSTSPSPQQPSWRERLRPGSSSSN